MNNDIELVDTNEQDIEDKIHVDVILSQVSGNINWGDILGDIEDQTDLNERLGAIDEAIVAEEERAQAAEQANANAIVAEHARATVAENTLQTNLDTESTARASADQALQEALNTEITNRTNADTTLQENIDTETARAQAAEAGKLDLMPGDEHTSGNAYNLPYFFYTESSADKVSVHTKTVTLDGTKTHGDYSMDVVGATTEKAGLMTAGDKVLLLGKADKTYVDEELSKKANASDVYTKEETNTAIEIEGAKHYLKTETYTKEEVNTELGKKQNNLSEEQLAAVNSGINTTAKASYDSHIADNDIHVTTAQKTSWTGKQDTISDLETIRSGASAGATAYQKPTAGISKTDLDSSVQISLGKADSALQSYTETDPVYTADKPSIALKSEIPTKVSELSNDKGYLTEHQDISGLATKNELTTGLAGKEDKDANIVRYQDFANNTRKTIQLANHNTISGIATTGTGHNLVMLSKWDVADFGAVGVHCNLNTKDSVTINDNKTIATVDQIPTVPENISAFNNDKGYLTEHQDLSSYATKSYVDDFLQIEDLYEE